MKTILFALILLAIAVPVEARSVEVSNCNGNELTYETEDASYTGADGVAHKPKPDGTYDDPPVDLCAKGQAGFMKLVFTIQVWGGVACILGIAVFALIFMFSGGNQQKRGVATGGLVSAGVALIVLIFAVDIVRAVQSIF